jgi:hypothetical protein
VNRYVVLYLARLIVLIPIDFLFLGTVAKGFFTTEVGGMLGEIRLAPTLRDLWADIAVGAQALDLVGGHGRCELGGVRDGGFVHDGADDRQLDRAQDLARRSGSDEAILASSPGCEFRYFGCGTIRRYGFGAFHPAG